jgi:hypothetical protein
MTEAADRGDDVPVHADEPTAPTEEPLVLPGVSAPLPVTSDPQAPAPTEDPLDPDVPDYPVPEPLPDPAPDWLRP